MSTPVPIEEFSIDDMLQELRAREQAPRAAALPGADAGVELTGMAAIETPELVSMLKDRQEVIYGVDDRRDLFQITDQALLNDADSVVALFEAGDITDNGNGTSTLQTQNYGTSRNLCSTEAFRNQPVGAFCSGFLVGADLIATAGHCVDAGNVTNIRFVFGFRMTNATTAQTVINNTEIYRGVSVVARQLVSNGADFAVVRIDRSVPNHRIVRIRRTGKIADNQAVHVIGHPVGLPIKIAGGAAVRNNTPAAFFVANLDTYGGNSGSPVFNSTTHEVEGILVRGETDFVSNGSCMVSLVCPSTGCRGEDCTRTTEFANSVPVLRSPRVPARAQIGVVTRSTDKLDIFATDTNGVIFTAAWEPAFTDWWHGWWELNGGRAAPGAPIHGVSRSRDKLDIFVTGTDNRVYTAAWEPAFTDWWHGWWGLNGGVASPGAHVTVVSRAPDKLDAFVVGTDGRVWTAAWEPTFTDWWHGWWPIGTARFPAGAPIHAVSRSRDKLDIFATDVNGVVMTAAWEPAFTDGWHGWWELNGGRAAPGAAVTTVSRSTDKLDVFVVGTDNRVWTAAWEPTFTDWWHGWWPIGTARFPAGAPIHAVSRSRDKLDIFGTDVNGVTMTAAWEPAFTNGWWGWAEINGGRAAPGAAITAVSRSTDKLDIFVVGTDNRVYTAAWEPTFTDWWHGWWPIGE